MKSAKQRANERKLQKAKEIRSKEIFLNTMKEENDYYESLYYQKGKTHYAKLIRSDETF